MPADLDFLLLAQGRIGIVDAALVHWLIEQRARTDRLMVHVTGSVFEPLLPRKHIELNCLPALLAFCPDYFVKSARDRSRGVVQAEAELVASLGGEAIFLAGQAMRSDPSTEYSSTALIRHVRQQTEMHEAAPVRDASMLRSTNGE